jgi:RNA polymerase sigma-70 factor (ECF subfamily)
MTELEGSAGSLSVDGTATPEASALFEEFFEAERDRLFKALFAITGSRDEAEDISQEAFVRLWERWDRVSVIGEPTGYLHRTAMNVFRDRRRRVVREMKRVIRQSPPPDGIDAVEARSVAATALGSLTRRQRAAVVLTEGLGYRAEEAGALLGIKGSTVRALLYQARSALSATPVEER